ARTTERPTAPSASRTTDLILNLDETPAVAVASPPVADPAPLGLAAFALTTFLLSAKNAHWTDGTDAWLGYALAYGGFTQLLAGMWEFRNRNVFGATAFSTYGGFWIGLGLYALLVAPTAASPTQIPNDEGWILLCIGNFANNIETLKVGGYVGIATAAAAWYASAAGVINGMGERRVLPVGGKIGQ